MKHRLLKLPAGCQIAGDLYDAPEPAGRGEDMIEITLPNGVIIDAGWYPEGDPKGRYRVAAHYGTEKLLPHLGTGDVQSLASLIEHVACALLNYSPATAACT
jgi:hypothetical protein